MTAKIRRRRAALAWLLALQTSSCAVEVQEQAADPEANREVGEISEPLGEDFGEWVEAVQPDFDGDGVYELATAPEGYLAVHAAYLRNGMILTVGGSNYNCCYDYGRNNTRLYAISSFGDAWGAVMQGNTPYPSTQDPFCSGHAHDYMGRVMFQGGLENYNVNGTGIGNSARYETGTQFTQLASTSRHYYPTLVAGVRHMFLFPGHETGGDARIKRFSYSGTTWTDTGRNQASTSTYPRVHLLPNGKFFVATPEVANRYSTIYDPVANTLSTTGAGTDVTPLEDPIDGLGIYDHFRGTSVLLPLTPEGGAYPNPKVAIFNGKTAYVKTLNGSSPTWQALPARPDGLRTKVRRYGNATLLPTGQVLLTGGINGNSDSKAVFPAEVYDPDPSLNSWLPTSASSVPRNYHSVALLLADGRVWTASSSIDKAGSFCGANTSCNRSVGDKTQRAVEYFRPWYFNHASRPVISSCPSYIATDGSQIQINIANNQGSNVAKVALMRAGSVTHSFDTDQRLIWLDITGKTSGTVVARGPYGAAAAPPGDYMLFALRDLGADKGFMRYVPSRACWTRVEPQRSIYRVPFASIGPTITAAGTDNYRPIVIDGYTEGASVFANLVFTKNPGIGQVPLIHWKTNDIQNETLAKFFQGYRMTYLDSYAAGGEVRHNAVFENTTGPEWVAYFAVTEAVHNAHVTNFKAQGFRPIHVSVAKIGNTRYYSAVWDKADVGDWTLATASNESQYLMRYASETAAGRKLWSVNAWMEGTSPRIVSIFDSQVTPGTAFARHAMTSSQYNTEHSWRLSEGQQLRSIAGYESNGTARWIARWSTH